MKDKQFKRSEGRPRLSLPLFCCSNSVAPIDRSFRAQLNPIQLVPNNAPGRPILDTPNNCYASFCSLISALTARWMMQLANSANWTPSIIWLGFDANPAAITNLGSPLCDHNARNSQTPTPPNNRTNHSSKLLIGGRARACHSPAPMIDLHPLFGTPRGADQVFVMASAS